MKIIEPKAELITEKNPYKRIELVGRTCYKSEDKITDDSAVKFVRGLIKSNHTAMVEHQVFVFQIRQSRDAQSSSLDLFLSVIDKCPYIHATYECPSHDIGWRILVSGSVRALNECFDAAPMLRALQSEYPDLVYAPEKTFGWGGIVATMVDLDTLPKLSFAEIEAHKVMTFRLTTDRGITHEIVRHRPASYAQESTRYCNYGNGKFGGEIKVICPSGIKKKDVAFQEWKISCELDEVKYFKLLNLGCTPQEARSVLPTCLASEIVVTMSLGELKHFFNLRLFGTTGSPHPDMVVLTKQMFPEAQKDPIFADWSDVVFDGLEMAD